MPENSNTSLIELYSQFIDKIMEKTSSNTFNDSISPTLEKVVNTSKDSKVMKDSYGNSILGIGNKDKIESFTNYGFSNDTLNWTLWTALYNDSWVFKRAIDKPSQDMVRTGITLTCESNKKEDIYKLLKKYRFDMIKLLQWGALYGGSIACIMLDNVKDADYSKPLQKEKLRTCKAIRMYVVDRWYGVEPSYDKTVTNMSDIDFGKPMYYKVTLANGHQVRFHHSYVLRYEHRTAPALIKNGQLQGWGYAEGSHIINELSRDDKLKASIQSLVDKSLIEIIKMAGMRGVFMGSDKDNEGQLRKRLEMVNWGRNFNSLTFLDKEDEYQQNTYGGLAGLSDLLEKNMWLISAALEMQGVLYGDLKQGFSNDTDALKRYDETINGRCESYLRPIYEKLISIFYKKYDIDEPVEFTFNSLLAKEQDKEQMDSCKKYQELLSSLLNDGVIDLAKYAKSLQQYLTKGIIDINITDEDIEALKDKMEEEMEDIDLDNNVDLTDL